MIRDWILQRIGSGTEGISNRSLYEIGDMMCRHHPDGIGYTDATHFGYDSMDIMLEDLYGGGEITMSMVRDLDQLLEDAEQTMEMARRCDGICPNKVETFRQAFFDQFYDTEIISAIGRIYDEIWDERFVWDELFQQTYIDEFVYSYTVNETEPAVNVADRGVSSVQTTQFREKSVDMKKLAARVNVVESNITDALTEMIDMEASLCYEKIRVSDDSGSIDTDDNWAYAAYSAMDAVRNAGVEPDTAIVDDMDYDTAAIDHLVDVYEDGCGVLDVPFVVADSTKLGYRVTRQQVDVRRPREIEYPYRYQVEWHGNYAVTMGDAISGPS